MKAISYWIFPVISAVFWLATLLGLLLWWVVNTHFAILPAMADKPHVAPQTIAYISDIGATTTMKPWFIVGSIFTTVFLDIGFFADRWLRHKGRLVPNTSTGEKILSGFCMFFALVGTIGLCFLSGFDTYHYPTLHDIFLLCFIGGYWISAVFICAEYQLLGKKYRQHRNLRISFWVKLAFIIVELALAVVFAVMNFRKNYDMAAIFEWVVAFVFTFWVLSFIIDLWPAVYTSGDLERKYSLNPMRTNEITDEWRRTHGPDGLVRDTIDSDRTLTNGGNHNNNNNSHHSTGGGGLKKFLPKKNGHSDL